MISKPDYLQSRLNENLGDILLILKAMANEKRFLILIQLLDGATSFNALIHKTQLQKTALANHLKHLIRANLITKPDYGLYQLLPDGKHFLKTIHGGWENSMVHQVKNLHSTQSKKMSRSFLESFFGKR